MASLKGQHATFLIDECLSPELTDIVKRDFGMFAIHVPWIGKPPHDTKSWQDPDIVDEIANHDYVFVTNNRRDFVGKYYPQRLAIHNGLVIIIQKSDLDGEKFMFRAAMDVIVTLEDTVNKLIEVDLEGHVTVEDWPNQELPNPWADPSKPR
jgi:hypothetical protein